MLVAVLLGCVASLVLLAGVRHAGADEGVPRRFLVMSQVGKLAYEIDVRDASGRVVRVVDRGRGLMPGRWSPDGSMIAWGASGGITVERADGTARRTLVSRILKCGHYVCVGMSFAWSPDSRSLLVAGTGKTTEGFLIVSVETGKVRGAVRSREADSYFGVHGWSPDGSKILYTRLVKDGLDSVTLDLVIADADGGNPRVLVSYGDFVHGGASVSWSPDSRSIALINEGREPNLRPCSIVTVASGKIRAIPGCKPAFAAAVWSPDSKRIAIAHPRRPVSVFTLRDNSRRELARSADILSWSLTGDLTLVETGEAFTTGSRVYAARNGRNLVNLLFHTTPDDSIVAIDTR